MYDVMPDGSIQPILEVKPDGSIGHKGDSVGHPFEATSGAPGKVMKRPPSNSGARF